MIPTIEEIAERLKKDLYNSRLFKKSSPTNPVKSEIICRAYKEKYNWDIESRDIRAVTKYLVENKIPIGTTLDGCYYVLKSEEWQPTLDMLMSKFLSMKNKINAIEKMRDEMAAQEAGQQKIPAFNILNAGLDLEKSIT